jgi:hypothetical protein
MDTDSTDSANAREDASMTPEPTVIVTEHGPYRVDGDMAIHDIERNTAGCRRRQGPMATGSGGIRIGRRADRVGHDAQCTRWRLRQ